MVVDAFVVGLPNLDHGAFHRFAFLVEHLPVHVDDVAFGFFWRPARA